MAWKPKTIAGKILKGVAIGAAAVGGVAAIAATGGAAAPAGIGLLGKIVSVGGKVVKTVAKTAIKGAGAVATSASNLVSGVTAQQRQLIQEQKSETREETQKLTTIEKLIRAGSTVPEAAAKVGVPLSELKGLFGIPSDAEAEAEAVKTEVQGITPETAGQGCMIYAFIIWAGLGAAIGTGLYLIL